MQSLSKLVSRRFTPSRFPTLPKTFIPRYLTSAIPQSYITTIKKESYITTPKPDPVLVKPTKPQPHPDFKVRRATQDDLKTVFAWASDISWYLSPEDAEVCYRSDPSGLYVGEINGEVMASYIMFNYGDYYFLTLHIVKEGFRDIGYGKKIEEFTRFFYKDGKVIFFDAADEGIDKYTKLGFQTFCWIKSYTKKAQGVMGPNVFDLKTIPMQEVFDYDLSVFGYPREKLFKAILEEPSYKVLGIKKDGKLKGFGLLRKCQKDVGYALSAIYADEKEIAKEIMESLESFVVGQDVFLEVFDCNPKAVELANEMGWNLMFECKRMHGGETPKLDKTRLYGDYCF